MILSVNRNVIRSLFTLSPITQLPLSVYKRLVGIESYHQSNLFVTLVTITTAFALIRWTLVTLPFSTLHQGKVPTTVRSYS